jgi:plasmid stabilization system protein ParE
MALKIELHPEARQDLIEVVEWYENQKIGLGIEFFDHYRKTRDIILEHPRLYRKTYRTFRKANVQKFPYCIVYTANRQKLFILAVFHHKRNAEVWKNRIL